jgi:hypothetical protein
MCRKKLVKLVCARPRSLCGSGLRKIERQTFAGIAVIALRKPFFVFIVVLVAVYSRLDNLLYIVKR